LPPADSPEWPRERAGALNVYACDTCHGALVVVLLDWGTTPFMLSCASLGGYVQLPPGQQRRGICAGVLSSAFYRVSPLFASHLTHGFYRPADTGAAMADEFAKLEQTVRVQNLGSDTLDAQALEVAKRETIEHVERGGLLLRVLSTAERDEWANRILRVLPTRGGSSHPGRFA
jgi:hypothetical protein